MADASSPYSKPWDLDFDPYTIPLLRYFFIVPTKSLFRYQLLAMQSLPLNAKYAKLLIAAKC